jgi:hypothetical protein
VDGVALRNGGTLAAAHGATSSPSSYGLCRNNAQLHEQTYRLSNKHGAYDYKDPQNISPALRINEGHKLAEFYSATTALRCAAVSVSHFCSAFFSCRYLESKFFDNWAGISFDEIIHDGIVLDICEVAIFK